MAILRVDDFSATADVLGMVKQIRYSKADQMLCIEATSADEAVAILGQLSIGKVTGLTAETTPAGEQELVATAFETTEAAQPAAPAPEPQPAPKAKAPAPQPAPPAEAAPPAKEEPKPAKAEKAAAPTEKRPAKRKPRKQRKLADDIASTPEPAAEPAPAPEPAPTPAPVEKSADPAPAPSNGAGSNGISEDLRQAKKMRDVISIIFDEGGKDVDSILSRCREIQPHIPVLARVRNLDDRVRRAIEVMGIIE